MKPSRKALCAWLASTLAPCAILANAGDIAFRDNFETHAYYGWPAQLGGSTTVPANTVLAYKVTIPNATTLDRFGIFAASGSGAFTMAVYTDSSNKPANLEYAMAAPESLPSGWVENYVPYFALSAGSHWIALRLQTASAIGYDSAQTTNRCVRATSIPNVGDPWPPVFGSSSCSITGPINLYLVTFDP